VFSRVLSSPVSGVHGRTCQVEALPHGAVLSSWHAQHSDRQRQRELTLTSAT